MILLILQNSQDKIEEVFVFVAPSADVHKVNVAGTFNDWNKDHDSLQVGSDGKTWTAKISIPYGKVDYKFVVNGTDWVLDPTAHNVPDGEGHTNSERMVLPPDFAAPASPSDGITARSALLFRPEEPMLNYDRGALQFVFRARKNDLAKVSVIENGVVVAARPSSSDDLYQYYSASCPWSGSADVRYEFKIQDGEKIAYYGLNGYSDSSTDPFVLDAKSFKPFRVPDWTGKAIVYQIFPDRFADGDPTNDPKNVQPFGAKPTYSNRFGGDAVGVQQHVDYLKSLGVGVVYFNPVFSSPSNHRYDTSDYLKIDPEFGTNAEFDAMTRTLQAAGIRTVMDFAFNHTATNFFAFQDIRDHGQASPYLSWYFIKSFPVTVHENPPYVAWYNFPSMPKLNVVNPATEKYLLDSVDYWRTHAALAGVRLDVANEVDPKLWRDLRAREKSADPNFWIVGEEWGNASQWLKGDQWDSTMGYEFRGDCLALFADRTIAPSEFLSRLTRLYSEYPPQVSRNLMNLLGSHDTPRFLTLCHDNKNLLELAAAVQLTWPGTPSIYYGDELGMTGGADPDNRRTMDWASATPDNPVLKYYKTLIAARNHSVALQQGDPVVLNSDDAHQTFAFARQYGDDAAVLVENLSGRPQTVALTLPSGKGFKRLLARPVDALSNASFNTTRTLSITLPPLKAALLLPGEDLDLSLSPGRALAASRTIKFGHRSPAISQGAMKS
jgi:cyclomaltodextrinase